MLYLLTGNTVADSMAKGVVDNPSKGVPSV